MPRILCLLATLLLLVNICNSQDLSLGLQAYYPFNGNANDVSGNNNNPSFNNAILTTDRNGNANSAYRFNGIDNYMRIPNSASLNTTGALSLCVWVRVNGYYQGTCHGNSIMMKGDNDFLPGNYFLRFDDHLYTNVANCTNVVVDETHQCFYGHTADASVPGYTPYIQTGAWQSVVYTSDGTNSKLYVNCELKASGFLGGDSFTNTYDLFLGKLNNPSYPYWFNGDMDEVRIYNRALTQEEVNLYGVCNAAADCNSWLYAPNQFSYVRVGDLDISGDQLTIEAVVNRTTPYLPGTGNNTEGDIVSKHTDPSDINYLLRPNHAYIGTTNGFFGTPNICDLELNKSYHVAMVYNGSTLSLYRNGHLMSQVAASGNLIQNNLNTQIGHYPAAFWNTQFVGYINEVRIWNVARTQAEINTYMNTSLPNPTTQTGLLGYYTFDDLLNKQGNAAFDGALFGAATISNTNPNCTFLADSCNFILPVSLTDFTASVYNKKSVQLQWKTEQESGMLSYIIERKDPWGSFTQIGLVQPRNTAGTHTYSFLDLNVFPNTNYQYRLRLVDADGSARYSEVKNIMIIFNGMQLTIAPNPANEMFKITAFNTGSISKLFIYNNSGQIVRSVDQLQESVSRNIPTGDLPAGMYYIVLICGNGRITERLVVAP